MSLGIPKVRAPQALTEAAIAAFRMVVGFLFACHGATTLFAFPTEPYSGATAELFAWPGWFAAVIQLVGGLLVFAGLGTRIAALVSSGSMAYAYFTVHQDDGLLPIANNGESSALFAWAFFLLVFTGGGAFALDRLIRPVAAAPAD